jgi:Tol biopolymer transport system component
MLRTTSQIGTVLKSPFSSLLFLSIAIAQLLWVTPARADQQALQKEFNIQYFAKTKGRLAFTYIKDGQRDIYVIDFSTLEVSPLISTPSLEEYPSWSPDGQTLLFYSDLSGDREIYAVNADGNEMRRLSNSPGKDEDPDWSPDGKRIVFQSSRDKKGTAIYSMAPDGSDVRRLPIKKRKIKGTNSLPKWSPRGTEIIYSTDEFWPGWDIALFSLKNKKTTLLTSGYRSFTRGSWHPSGGSFAFSYGSGNDIDIWKFEKGASELQPLVVRPGRDYDAEWSDDGALMFFVGEKKVGSNTFDLYVWDANQNKTFRVTEAEGSIRHPNWTSLPSLTSLKLNNIDK